jgi:division protein CdvB (Snf7/Vps24/ESCRT-III family)
MAIWRVLRANLDTSEMTLRSQVDAAIKRLQPARAMRYRRIAARLLMTPPDDRAGSAR